MKFLAFYLPQYHEIPENNEWWGDGFTDWTNVKKASPLYKGHRQPRIPQNENYYDLSKVTAIKSQAELAKKYNIDGFCIYHYWFGGKLLLEKPVEILRQNVDIDIEYCFSWANEPWARTWDGKNNDVLIAQEYGTTEDWEKHFYYFLPYFQDNRYIKIEKKPMLLIYKCKSIPCFEQMIQHWNELAKKHGFNGIYLVETLREKEYFYSESFSAHVEFEPTRTMSSISIFRLWGNRIIRYSKLFFYFITKKNRLANKVYKFENVANASFRLPRKKNTYGGIFMGWDNTPRKNKLGTVITEPTKEQFKEYVLDKVKQVQQENDENNQFLFINAWNEWAEGTYLEPDTVNECMYLDVIREVVSSI